MSFNFMAAGTVLSDFGTQENKISILLLSCFSRVRLCETPEMAAHQVPPSPGFSRQEHWSGLPFPSPMHESEKWKWSCKTHSIIAFSTILSPFSAIFLSLNSNSQPYLYGITFHLVFFFLHIAHQTKWLSVWRTSYNVLYLSWYQA